MRIVFCLLALLFNAAAPAGVPLEQQQPHPATTANAKGDNAGDLRRGQALLDQLRLDPAADAAVFSALPPGAPEQLLTAVITFNQGYASNPAQWPHLHRAIAAMAELCNFRKQTLKAAMYESLQATMYSTYDENYPEALAASRRSLALAEQVLPPAGLVPYLSPVGRNLYHLGQYDEALEFLRRVRENATDKYDALNSNNWRTIVLIELARKNPAGARAEAESFAAASKSGQASALFRAESLLALSDISLDAGDYDRMLRLVQQAMAAAAPDAKAEIAGYECVAQVLQGVLAASTLLPYDQAMAVARRVKAGFPHLPVPIDGFAENIIRRRRRAAGELDAILREDNARLQAARQQGNPVNIADALLFESLDYAWVNGARQEITLLDEASGLLAPELEHAKYPGSEGVLDLRLRVLTNLGLACAEAHEFDKARAAWDEMDRVVDSVPAGIAQQQADTFKTQALFGRARTAAYQDDPEAAIALLRQALPRARSKGGPSRSEILFELARAMDGAHVDATSTAATFERAVEAAGEERDRDLQVSARVAYAKFLTASAHGLPKAEEQARRQLGAAQQDASAMHLAGTQWKVEYGWGLLEEASGHTAAAIARYETAVAMVEKMRAGLSVDENRQSLFDSKSVQELYERLIGLLSRSGPRGKAWEYLERDKARSFSEMLRDRKFAAGAGDADPAPLRQMASRLLHLRLQLAPDNVPLLRASGRDPGMVQQEFDRLQAEYELKRHERELKSARGQPASGRVASLTEVQRRLARDTALIEYGVQTDAVLMFVTTSKRLAQVRQPADGKKLRRDLLGLRRALASPDLRPRPDRLIQALSDTLIAPAIARLPRGITRLYVVPAGAMNYVPFQVLRLPDGRQVVDAFTVSYLPSASSLTLLHDGRLDSRSLFVGALGSAPVPGWPALPGTVREAAAIARLFPRASLVTGPKFTAAEVLSALQEKNTVHLATHGDLDDQAPLFSAIITSPTGGQPDRVSLYQVMDTRLKSRLVVLSACQTALGKLLGGDEVSGLTRTLLLSGANDVVSTLWNIDDAVTVELMQAFYKAMKRGLAPADALRKAELQTRKAHPEPAYWSPFILTGR